ncbi:MAG TPA: universal stress protein [Planctomycetota bacterium]|nr:universal stress protein [Planctomycetota bacterium]
MYRRILVASDLTEWTLPALKIAVEMARASGARLHLEHVIEPFREARPWLTALTPPEVDVFEKVVEQETAACRDALRKQFDAACAGGPTPDVEIAVRRGPPADVIAAEAQNCGADLVVVGTHGRKGLKHLLLGSVAERVARIAPCSVLIAR